MNHSNLYITVNSRNKHPYGVLRRLQFFAHNAGKVLVPLPIDNSKHLKRYAVANK